MLDSEWFVRDFRVCVVMIMLAISFFRMLAFRIFLLRLRGGMRRAIFFVLNALSFMASPSLVRERKMQ